MASLLLMISCKKDFLDTKPVSNISVPVTLNDLQMLLDNTDDLDKSPSLGELSSDDYYMISPVWNNQVLPYYANCYIWVKDIFAGNGKINDWNLPYSQVLCANIALQQLNIIKRTPENAELYDSIKGNAYFKRAWAFFDLTNVFTLPYDSKTASTDLGIPLRLTADVSAGTERSTVKGAFEQILSDLVAARALVKNETSLINQNRVSKASIYGLLSRVHLTLRNYPLAGLYADSTLKLHSKLIDYNTVDSTARAPFSISHDEMVYQSIIVPAAPLSFIINTQGYSIDTTLYNMYEKNDLRKTVYFQKSGIYIFKRRGYSGQTSLTNGIATDELLLTRAECYARTSNDNKAIDDLNNLLSKRWIKGTFVPFQNLNGAELLNTILRERRKELVFRTLRWLDLRRLNKEGYNITLTRNVNGNVYMLPPNDLRYALPIPPDVITLSGIQQNNR